MVKGDYVDGAYEQMTIWGVTTNATPREVEIALKRLNGLLLHWENQNIFLGWNVGAEDPNDESGLPDWAQEAVFTNLAIKLLPVYGRGATLEQKQDAAAAYEAITLSCINNMEYPDTMPVGAGNQRYGYSSRRFFVESDPDNGNQCNTGINL
jgi:hypothetical protein